MMPLSVFKIEFHGLIKFIFCKIQVSNIGIALELLNCLVYSDTNLKNFQSIKPC